MFCVVFMSEIIFHGVTLCWSVWLCRSVIDALDAAVATSNTTRQITVVS